MRGPVPTRASSAQTLPSDELEPLLTPADVCRILKITKKTLYRWAYLWRCGNPTGPEMIKVGGSNRYRPRDVRDYMRQQAAR